MSIWMIRLATTKTLFNFFGYLSPALNSTKAIISKDEEGIREYLTYWCVFGLLLYLEFILSFFSALRNWPPESKVLFILWLTLPQFQGAYRIYSYILKPYFEKFEDEIDKQIDIISRRVSEKAHRHFQTILWQLFLAPNDGLLAGVLSMSTSFPGKNLMTSILCQPKMDTDPSITNDAHEVKATQRPTSLSLRKQLLDNFSEMLVEGIYADVRHSGGCAPLNLPSIVNEMQINRVTLLTGGYYLQLSKEIFETATGDEEIAGCLDDNNMNITLMNALSSNIFVPLFLVTNVSSDNIDPNLIVMSISSVCRSPTQSLESDLETTTVCMRVESEEEGEALLAGMIVLCADTRKRASRKLDRAVHLLKSTTSLSISFKTWVLVSSEKRNSSQT